MHINGAPVSLQEPFGGYATRAMAASGESPGISEFLETKSVVGGFAA